MKRMANKSAIALAAAALIGTSGAVQASVSATAMVDITGLVFLGSDGQILDGSPTTGDFSFLTFTASADVSAEAFGGPATTASGGPATPIDLLAVCQGDCPAIGENVFPVISGAATSSYAAADQFEAGAPILNSPDLQNAPASVANGSYVAVDDGDATTTSANSNNNINSSFIFSLTQTQGVTIQFDARAYLEAHVDSIEVFPGDATAAYTVDFVITDLNAGGTIVYTFAPDGTLDAGENADPFSLNSTVSLNAPLPVDITSTNGIHTIGTASTGFFSATTPVLTAGNLYQLSARINTNADANRVIVPEPGLVAMLGLGLLGIAALRRRRMV